MNMKKSLLFAGLATVLTLAACSKSEVNPTPKGGNEITVIALSDDTKTSNNGLSTEWKDGDALTAFYAEAGTTDYSNNIKFTYTSGNAFTGTADLDDGTDYDWYFLYPYNSYLADPANSGNSYGYIGSRSDYNQKQNGYDNKAHLAGGSSDGKTPCFPLYGVVENVPNDEEPVVTMHQLATVVAIKVTNTTSAPVLITSASITAEENIVGSFYYGVTKTGPVITDNTNASYMSNTATVEVTNPTDLATGESAILYVGVKPFTAASGTDLILTVKGSNGEVSSTKAMTSDVEFASGHIKTLKINYDKEAVASTTEWIRKEVVNITSGARVVIVGTNASGDYAMSNDNGTSSAPAAKAVVIENYKLKIAPDANIQWDVTKDASGNFTFYPAGVIDKWLYCTNTNNGVRVGTNDAKLFTFGADGYFVHSGTSRIVGIYNSADWRCYSSIVDNIKNQEFAFYQEVEKGTATPDAPKTPLDKPANVTATLSSTAANAIDVSWDAVTGAAAYLVTAVPTGTGSAKTANTPATSTTFTDLEYNTVYTISVVALPSDTDKNANSEAAEAASTVTTGADPSADKTYKYVFTSQAWKATLNGSDADWTSVKNGGGFSNNGIQVTASGAGASGTSPVSFTNVTKVVLTYNTNKSQGAGEILVKVGDNTAVGKDAAYGGSGDGRSAYFTLEYEFSPAQNGEINITVNTTTNSIYLVSAEITAD